MTDATITVEELQGTTKKIKLVKIVGQLDESNVDERIKTVYKLLEENPNLNILFDLGGLEYMNSKSIGYLTDLYGKVTETGGQVAIAKAPANIADILQVVGLSQLIKCHETLDEAKAYIESAPAPVAAPAPAPAAPVAPAAPAPAPIAPTAPPTPQT